MKRVLILMFLGLSLVSCENITEKAKSKIKDVGEGVGAGVSELGKGIKEGVEDSFGNKLSVNENLSDSGLDFGKVISKNQSFDVYVIFNKNFSDTLIVKVFDEENQEIGRTTVLVEGKKDDAKYVSVYFDHPTYIGFNSKFTIEKKN